MPNLPPGAHANMLSNFKGKLVNWMDGDEIPLEGPHAQVVADHGCTILQDFSVDFARANFKTGMQGHAIGNPSQNGDIKVYFRGISEQPNSDGIWVENLWLPSKYVQKGKAWRPNINDWDFRMNLSGWRLGNSTSSLKATPPDSSVLSKTITRFIEEFHANPASFMGTKIQELLDKRRTRNRGSTIESVTKAILQGIRGAGLYNTLNDPNFTITDITNNASFRIDRNSPRGTGGVYVRYHTSSAGVTHWQPNTKYFYVGKSVDFKDRFDNHPSSTTSYGDLTRNSQRLFSSALCILDETDNMDFAYLVEQIFVCLFESYRSSLLVGLNGAVDAAKGIKYIESIQAAYYFRKVSEKVFSETGFPGALNRSSFGVSQGANYSMPFKEWAAKLEQLLWLRSDMFIKNKGNGESMPISLFRRAQPKTANYISKKSWGTSESFEEMYAFQKYHEGKHFFSIRHNQRIKDGTMGPRQGDSYELVFEVRTDGKAHPNAWSRLYSIGGFQNWDEGRALAVRMEWQHPPNSGKWRHRYLYSQKPYTFKDRNQAGSQLNYIKTIGMIRWLFDAEPNNLAPYIPHLRGCAYVLQTDYNYHTQTIEVKLPELFTMRSGARKPRNDIVTAMQALGLENVDGPIDPKNKCDSCGMLDIRVLTESLGQDCVIIPDTKYCRNCALYGRGCCSWTKNSAVRGKRNFSAGAISGTVAEVKVTSADVALNEKFRAGLHRQPLPNPSLQGESFSQQLIDVMNLMQLEDDFSDVEDADEAFEDDDDDDDAED